MEAVVDNLGLLDLLDHLPIRQASKKIIIRVRRHLRRRAALLVAAVVAAAVLVLHREVIIRQLSRTELRWDAYTLIKELGLVNMATSVSSLTTLKLK